MAILLVLSLFSSGTLADVSVNGLKEDAKNNTELMLSLRKESCSAAKWKIQRLFNKSDQEIEPALRALGYYHPIIKKKLQFDDDCWTARFDIQPGPQVLVKSISITITGAAKDDLVFKNLKKKAERKTGIPLNHGEYENLKSRFEALAMTKGYLQATFTKKKLLVNPKNNSATIELIFASQERKMFGEISVVQNTLQPDFVEKFIPIKTGEFYSSKKLAKTYQALSQSGYFTSVDIQPNTETTQNSVPIDIKLEPRKRHHYQLGVGFDTDVGPLLSGGYSNRRLNDRGHFFNSELNLSPVLSIAEATYSVPLAKPLSDYFSIGAGFKREATDSFTSLSATLSARLNHAFDNGWKQVLFLDYSYEDFDTDSKSEQTLLLIPGGSWQKSVANNLVRPTKAYRTKIDVSGSYKNPLSDVSFLQAAFSGVWIHPLPFKGKFIGRSEFGATLVDQFSKLPTTYRFYAGGINSVRGYDYKELGPKDDKGHVEGGQFLAILSAEYEQAIFENWGIAGFIDTGNAFHFDKISFKTGAGIGIRWYSPFGPIRVDFALPLNDASSSFQVHFAAGTRL